MRATLQNIAIAFAAALLLGTSAMAAKPVNPGNSGQKHAPPFSEGSHPSANAKQAGPSSTARGYFDATRRSLIADYYQERGRNSFCPPGLAKKQNGCLPPGQARKWQRSQRLPDDVRPYPISEDLRHILGTIPADHRIVRVGNDLLLIQAGSRIVIDALENLSELF
ncbi:hypothetical protein [Algiphilus sp.]|uniref:hypothetical protein n=1 Tax=Algiphilus sp. TaxID=1872431 RepID=UPI003B52BA17